MLRTTFLILTVIVIKKTLILAQSSDELTEIVKSIVERSFIGKSTVIYCVDLNFENSNINHFIEAALMKMENKTYVMVNSTNTLETYKSTAHLAIFQNNLHAQNLRQYIPDHILGENIRAVVFFEKNYAEDAYLFEDTYPVGSEIILVSVIQTEDKSFKNIKYLNKVCVYLTWNKKSLCINNSKNLLNKLNKIFDGKSWRPKPNQAVTVETFECPPFVHYDKLQGKYSGIEYNIIQEITRNWLLNMNIANYSNNDKSKWNFLVDVLLEGKADIGMCSLWLNSMVDLFPNVSITYPFIDICVTLVVPKPQVLPDISYVFQPIQFDLWVVFVIFVPSIALLIWLFSLRTKAKLNYCDFILGTIRILTVGSVPTRPSADSLGLRTMLVTMSITSLLLSTAYSAGFISLLTFRRLANPILYLEDVVNMNVKIDIEVGDVKPLAMFLKKFENVHIKKMANLVVASHSSHEYRTVDTKDFARIVKLIGQKYVSDTDTFDEYKKTHLRLLKECLFQSYSTFVLRKYSRYVPFFNKMLMRLNEHGFITHWYKQSTINPRYNYMNNFFSSYVSESFGHVSINFSKLKGAFVMLGIGSVLALIAFVREIRVPYF